MPGPRVSLSLDAQQGDAIRQFLESKRALKGLGEELSAARAKATELAAAMRKSGDAKSVQAFQAARSEASRLKQAFTDQQQAVQRTRSSLSAAGIDVARLSAEYRRLREAAAGASAAQDSSAGVAGVRKIGSAVQSMSSTLVQLRQAFVAVFALRAVVNFASTIANASQQFQQLSARIQLTTRTTQEFERAQRGVFEIAQRTGTSLEGVAALYVRTANALQASGTSQREVLAITEDVGRALKISGASGQEAASAMLQFSQALGAGTLRGEELNAILEAAPRLAQAIADGLEVPVGQLKKLGEDGALTGQLVARALRSQSAVLRGEAARLPDTLGQSWERLGNAVQKALGEFDRATGISAALARSISGIAETVGRASPQIDELTARLRDLREERESLDAANAVPGRAVRNPLDALAEEYTAAAQKLQVLQGRFDALQKRALRPQAAVGEEVAARQARRQVEQQTQLLDELRAKLLRDSKQGSPAQELANNQFDAILTKYRDNTQKLKAALDELRTSAQKAGIALDSPKFKAAEAAVRKAFARRKTGSTKVAQDLTDERLAVDRAAVEAGARLEEDALSRVRASYRAAYEQRLIDARTYYEADARLQQQALDARLQALQQERDAQAARFNNPAGTESDRLRAAAAVKKLDADIAVAARTRAQVEVDAARAAKNAEEELARAIRGVRLELADAAGTASIEDRRKALQEQNRALIEQLQAAGDQSGVADVNRLIDQTAATQQLQQFERQAQQILERVRLQEERVRTEVETGLTSEITGRERVAQVRAQAVPQLQEIARQMEAISQASGGAFGPEQSNRIEGLKQSIEGLARVTNPLREQFKNIAESGLTDFLVSLGDRATTLREKFGALIRGIASDLARLAAQQLSRQLLSSLFSAGAGAASGGAGAAPVTYSADGGYITGPGTATSDSIPAMLSNGEYVVRAAAVQKWGVAFLDWLNAGMSAPAMRDGRMRFADGGLAEAAAPAQFSQDLKIVNVMDPGLVGDYLGTRAGEKAILNILKRNGGALRAAIG